MADFVLVHGAWHDGSCWDLLQSELRRRGHSTIAPDLPCDDLAAGFEEYAEVVLAACADLEKPVLVGHSMGSDTVPLVAVRRPITLLVYLCPRLGGFDRPAGAPEQFRPDAFHGSAEDDLGRGFWPRDAAIRHMYRSLPHVTAEALASRLRPQSYAMRARPYPLTSPPDVPSALVYTEQDEFFEPGWCDWAAREFLRVDPVVLPGGHFPMVERPSELAHVLEALATGAAHSVLPR